MAKMKPLRKSRIAWTALLIVFTGLSTAVSAVVPLTGLLRPQMTPEQYLLFVAFASGLSGALGMIVLWLRAQDARQQMEEMDGDDA